VATKWPDERVIVETDGWQTHGTRTAFERDRRRDLDLTAAGWRVIRIGWRLVSEDPARVSAMLRKVLA
jgi:very-short-patch-repair endonuclease